MSLNANLTANAKRKKKGQGRLPFAAASQQSNPAPAFLLSKFDTPNASSANTSTIEYLASVSQALDAHRVTVWDTRTSAHLVGWSSPSKNVKFTSLAWGRAVNVTQQAVNGDDAMEEDEGEAGGAPGDAKKKKKKRRRKSGAPDGEKDDPTAATGGAVNGSTGHVSRILAVGTSTGDVNVYSLATGQLVKTLVSNVPSPVTDMAFGGAPFGKKPKAGKASTPILYTVSASGDVMKWDWENGSLLGKFKEPSSLSRIAVHPKTGRVLVAGLGLKLYDPDKAFTSTGNAAGSLPAGVVREFTGHATQISECWFLDNVQEGSWKVYCVSAAKEDRFLSVWDCTEEEGDVSASGNVSALTLDNPPLHLSVSDSNHVLALDELGIVDLWGSAFKSNSSNNKPTKKSGRPAITTLPFQSSIEVVSSASEKERNAVPILAATFETASGTSTPKTLIAYGHPVKPTFERVPFLHIETHELLSPVQLTRNHTDGGLLMQDPKVAKAKQLAASTQPYRQAHDVAVVGDRDMPDMLEGVVDDEAPAELDEDGPEAAGASTSSAAGLEPTLEERLKEMALDPSTAPTPPRSSGRNGPRKGPPRNPTAASLHSMLSQAVHSSDRQLLETTLMVSDPKIILATVRRLPARLVVPLLDMLVGRLAARPSRAGALIEWVRAVVVAHAAFLMTDQTLVRHLGALHQTLDARVSTFQRLLKLSGRLDLVMSQIALRSSQEVGADSAAARDTGGEEEAEAVYDEERELDENEEDGAEFDDDDEVDGRSAGWDEEEEEDDEDDIRSDSEEEEDDDEDDEDEDDGDEDEDGADLMEEDEGDE
ncbi:WD repeat-containing protein 43 [Irineochytrium annulatum]|nr:WD repeat-containing protein 43 [Irineochytrium annulatum]